MDRSRIVNSTNILGFSVIAAFGLYRYLKSINSEEEDVQQDEKVADQVRATDSTASTGCQYVTCVKKRLEDEAVQARNVVRSQPHELTAKEAEALVSSLQPTTEPELLCGVLTTIQNAAAFTSNQSTLREVGALSRLSGLLRAHNMALHVGQSVAYPAVINGVITSINNMAVNEHNQSHLKDCIPTLIDFASSADKVDESIQLASLQALTNLSVKPEYHEPYTKLIQQLYGYLDNGTHNIRIQAMRVLANLSTNHQMVPHLLAAKAPLCLYELLSPDEMSEILIRWTTILANIMCIVKEKELTAAALPTEYKAPSPEMTFTGLYGHNNVNKFKSKVYVLSRHQDPDVRHQASRIYGCFT